MTDSRDCSFDKTMVRVANYDGMYTTRGKGASKTTRGVRQLMRTQQNERCTTRRYRAMITKQIFGDISTTRLSDDSLKKAYATDTTSASTVDGRIQRAEMDKIQ